MWVTLRAVSRLLDFHWQKCESREGSGALRLTDVTQEVSPKVTFQAKSIMSCCAVKLVLVHIFPDLCMFHVLLDRGPFSLVKVVSLVFLFTWYKSSVLVGGATVLDFDTAFVLDETSAMRHTQCQCCWRLLVTEMISPGCLQLTIALQHRRRFTS